MSERDTVLLISQIDDARVEYVLHQSIMNGIRPKPQYHDHSVWELHAVLGGSMKIYLEGTEYPLMGGDLFFIPPGRMHYLYENGDTRRMGFRFSFSRIPQGNGGEGAGMGTGTGEMFRYLSETFSGEAAHIRLHAPEISGGYLARAMECFRDGASDFMTAQLLQTAVLSAASVMRPLPETAAAARNRETDSLRIVRMEEFINENYQRHIALSEAAELFHLSEKQTERTVLRLFGKPFTALIAEKRLAIACFLLRRTDMKLEQVAVSAGYGTMSYFCRQFGRAMHMPPGAYRTANRK